MAKEGTTTSRYAKPAPATPPAKTGKPSALLDTRVGYRGDKPELIAPADDSQRRLFLSGTRHGDLV